MINTENIGALLNRFAQTFDDSDICLRCHICGIDVMVTVNDGPFITELVENAITHAITHY